MAVEAVVALMVDKLAELLRKDAQLLGMHGEINRIRVELDKMRPFLKDADIKQKEDEAVRVWMKDIRDICFDVDDVIDILGQGQAAQGRRGFVERLKRCISDQITRYKVGNEIERIKLNIKGISRSRESYGIRETSSTQRLQEVSRCSVPPEKIEIVITTVDEQLTNEERTRDIDEGRQEATSLAPCLQADRQFSTLLGESEEVGLQEQLYKVSQQLIKELEQPTKAQEATKAKEAKTRFLEDLINSAPHLQEVSRCSVPPPPEKIEIVFTPGNDQLTNEERTRDIDEGRQEASSSSRNLQAHRPVSTLPGEPEEVGLQEEINTVGQQLIEEELRPWDGTKDINEGKLEASSSTPGLKADRRFSTLLGDSEEVGLQEGINTVGQQFIKEEPEPYDGTRDIDEGRLEASSSAPCLQADRQFSTLLGESEEVGLEEELYKVSQQLIKELEQPTKAQEATKAKEAKTINSAPHLQEVSRCSVPPPPEKIEIVFTPVNDQLTNEERTRDIDEGRQEASSSSRDLQAHRPVSNLPGEPEEVGLQEEINTVGKQFIKEEPGPYDGTRDIDEGRLEASFWAPSFEADWSTLLGISEEVGLQEEIDTVSEQSIKEAPGPYDGTRYIDEGRLEASSLAPSIQACFQVDLAEDICRVREKLIKEEPSPCDGTRVIDEGSECGDGSKKRKMQPKWTEQVRVSSGPSLEGPPDDGHSWRKYGQKEILGAKFPRAYYRCTHRNVQGCAAKKQVQRSEEDPSIFNVMYQGHHTCISEGKLEASSTTPGLKADRGFSTLLGDSEEVGLQEGINTVGQQLIKEESGPYDGTRDIDEGRLEASSLAPILPSWFYIRFGESEEVGLQEVINTVRQQLIEEEPGPYDALGISMKED